MDQEQAVGRDGTDLKRVHPGPRVRADTLAPVEVAVASKDYRGGSAYETRACVSGGTAEVVAEEGKVRGARGARCLQGILECGKIAMDVGDEAPAGQD